MLHRCNVRKWEWEGMGIDCTGMGGSGNVKSHFRASLTWRPFCRTDMSTVMRIIVFMDVFDSSSVNIRSESTYKTVLCSTQTHSLNLLLRCRVSRFQRPGGLRVKSGSLCSTGWAKNGATLFLLIRSAPDLTEINVFYSQH